MLLSIRAASGSPSRCRTAGAPRSASQASPCSTRARRRRSRQSILGELVVEPIAVEEREQAALVSMSVPL